MKLTVVLTVVLALIGAPAPAQAQQVTGAGSTFAFPILANWSKAIQRAETDAEFQPVGAALDYESIGSQAGIMRLRENAVDFGATDAPLSTDELARYGFGQFPIVIGGVVAAVNIEGIDPGELKLTGEVLADIFLGRVRTWADPAIAALNDGLSLPDAPIAVIHRSDGSGTTFNFTNYLAKLSPDWRSQVGHGLLVTWPTGAGAKGNLGMAEAVKATPNAIGYVEFAQARASGLAFASIRNQAGVFVAPGTASFQAAADSADWTASSDFNLLLTDAPGEAAYPIAATVFAVMAKDEAASQRAEAAIAFFRWSLDNGAKAAADLGYVPLPASLVTQVKAYWGTAFGIGG